MVPEALARRASLRVNRCGRRNLTFTLHRIFNNLLHLPTKRRWPPLFIIVKSAFQYLCAIIQFTMADKDKDKMAKYRTEIQQVSTSRFL